MGWQQQLVGSGLVRDAIFEDTTERMHHIDAIGAVKVTDCLVPPQTKFLATPLGRGVRKSFVEQGIALTCFDSFDSNQK